MRILNLNKLTIGQSKLLNCISTDIVLDYHVLMEKIYKKTDKNIDWIVSSLFSRNNRSSQIFLDLCYLELVKRIDNEEYINQIICKTSIQKKILKQHFKSLSRKIEIISGEQIKHILRRLAKPFREFVYNILISYRYLRSCNKRRRDMIPKNKGITIVDTFFIPSMFEKGNFKDRYYPGLIERLPKNIGETLYFVPTVPFKTNLKQALEIATNANENFLYKFDFLKLKDYLFALFSPLRLILKMASLNGFSFRDFDINFLIKEEIKRNLANTSSFLGILNYRFFLRIKEKDINLRLVINWFENQTIDRGFNKGSNEFYPKTEIIGYQGFIIPYDFNQYVVPTRLEVETGQIPDKIAVIGKSLIPQIKKFYHRINVVSAPAFRFFEMYNRKKREQRKPDKIPTILLALPITILESISVLNLVIDAHKLEVIKSMKWFIKPHPSLNLEKLKVLVHEWPADFNIVEGNFSDCIERTDLLVGNASSTAMEALAYGIPVIIAGNQNGITQNPIPETIPKTMWELCYTAEEFNIALHRLLLDVDDTLRNIQAKNGEQLKKDYFEPVTEEGVLKFLHYINNKPQLK